MPGSFRDTPPSAGAYWYRIHAVDSTGNRGKEPNPPGPVKVNVATVASKVTANPNASAQTVKLLNYFKGLSGRSTKRVLSGHSFGDHVDEIVPLFNQTGKWPAIIGADPYWYCAKCLEPEFTFYNPIFINHWNNGGLITLHIHPGNPEKPGVTLGGDIDIEALLTPGTATNLLWMNALKLLADGLEELQDAGVVVLWRPFHEMCGGFWWGMTPRPRWNSTRGTPCTAQSGWWDVLLDHQRSRR